MSRNYTVTTKIRRPVEDVYAAIVDRQQMSRYFTDRSSQDLSAGDRVTWIWDEWGEFPVTVKTMQANRLIELALDSKAWQKTSDDAYEVLVTFEFEATEEGDTLLSISESGWRTDAEGLKGSHDNCSGWTHMAMCLKGFLEHGLDLR